MDPGIEFAQEFPNPLVFLLGTKSSQDYLINVYDTTPIPKKSSYNFL